MIFRCLFTYSLSGTSPLQFNTNSDTTCRENNAHSNQHSTAVVKTWFPWQKYVSKSCFVCCLGAF